jgi:hypothetical protein
MYIRKSKPTDGVKQGLMGLLERPSDFFWFVIDSTLKSEAAPRMLMVFWITNGLLAFVF